MVGQERLADRRGAAERRLDLGGVGQVVAPGEGEDDDGLHEQRSRRDHRGAAQERRAARPRRVRATADNPEFSVWWGGPADAFIAANEEGLLEAYESPNAEMLIEEYRGDGTWAGVYVGALGFCSNVELLEELGIEAPTSWDDLLDPALAGNIAMAHPATSGTAFTAFWSQVTLQADALEEAEAGTGYDEEGAPTQAANS